MRYATAIWNYAEAHIPLTDLVRDFADFGYDTISFLPWQFINCESSQAQDVVKLMDERGLAATVHGNFDTPLDDAHRIIDLLGDRLLAMTFDAAMRPSSLGTVFDSARMAQHVQSLLDMTPHANFRLAVEDYPLDALALGFHREHLGELIQCERYGMLVDVGHMNMRLRAGGYFEGQSVMDYFRRLPLPVVEVHLHDNSGPKDEHGHFGLGNIDFGQVAGALKAIGFQGISTIEIAPAFHGSNPAESRPRSKDSLDAWKWLWEG